jgi:hypothetical protein
LDSTSLGDNNHTLKSLPLKTNRVFLIGLTFTPLPTAGNVIEISQKLYSATDMFYANAFIPMLLQYKCTQDKAFLLQKLMF